MLHRVIGSMPGYGTDAPHVAYFRIATRESMRSAATLVRLFWTW